MEDYLLIYERIAYPDMGGGYYFLLFPTIQEMEDKINELHQEYGGNEFKIEMAAQLKEIFVVEAVEKITRFQIKE